MHGRFWIIGGTCPGCTPKVYAYDYDKPCVPSLIKRSAPRIYILYCITSYSYSITSRLVRRGQSTTTKPLESLPRILYPYLFTTRRCKPRVRVWLHIIIAHEWFFNVRAFLDTSHSFVKLPRCKDPSPLELLRWANIIIITTCNLLLYCSQSHNHRVKQSQHGSVI